MNAPYRLIHWLYTYIKVLQIGETIVSLDVIEKEFICDLSDCLGSCCIEGEAGAPLLNEEQSILQKLLPIVWNDLLPQSKQIIQEQGVAYHCEDGELVTSIVGGKDCVFAYYEKGGFCKCAIEKAFHEGKTDFYKPISCHLYPIRVKEYDTFSAINYHRWKICKAAEVLGRKEGIKIFQFLKAPLIRRFGEIWYEELEFTANEYLRQIKEEQE